MAARSVEAPRTMPGAAALAHLDRMLTLELAAARGAVIDIEIEHL